MVVLTTLVQSLWLPASYIHEKVSYRGIFEREKTESAHTPWTVIVFTLYWAASSEATLSAVSLLDA